MGRLERSLRKCLRWRVLSWGVSAEGFGGYPQDILQGWGGAGGLPARGSPEALLLAT